MSGVKKNLLVVRLVHLLIVAALVVLDQITKVITRNTFAGGNDLVLIKGVLRFTFLKNTGAVWGSFTGNTVLLSIVSVFILVFILWLYFKIPDDKKYLPIKILSLLIVAGAIGNLIDRVFFGYVTDFIYFELINFPVFNVADCYITVSCILLVILMLTVYRNDEFEFLGFGGKKKTDKG